MPSGRQVTQFLWVSELIGVLDSQPRLQSGRLNVRSGWSVRELEFPFYSRLVGVKSPDVV